VNGIFDIVNCDENMQSQDKFFQLLENGEAILFVGSGISKRFGYPSWEDLLYDLANLLKEEKDKSVVKHGNAGQTDPLKPKQTDPRLPI